MFDQIVVWLVRIQLVFKGKSWKPRRLPREAWAGHFFAQGGDNPQEEYKQEMTTINFNFNTKHVCILYVY